MHLHTTILFSLNVLKPYAMSFENRDLSLQCMQELVKVIKFRVKHRWCSRVTTVSMERRLEDTNIALAVVVPSSVVNFKFD